MTTLRPRVQVALVAILGGLGPWLAACGARLAFGDTPSVDTSLHEWFELTGGGAALGVAVLLLLRLRHDESAPPHLVWVVSALLTLGTTDSVHGVADFGVAWSWIRHGGTLVDLTERKRNEDRLRASLREKEALLREVHHRVKNNLQIISSLVSLQTRGIADQAALAPLREVVDRVRSIALVHDRLYRSEDLARIDLADYVRRLVEELWRVYGGASDRTVQARLELEPVLLPVDVAVPCGLMLNELLTNALKHAFDGRPSGEVAVSLRVDQEGSVRLSIRDDGVGLPPGLDLGDSPTLGLQLVQTLATQLGASVEVESSHGARFDITLAASPPA